MRALLLAALVLVAGCSINPIETPYEGITADAASTAIALSQGATEVGLLGGVYEPITIPLAVGLRYWYVQGQRGKESCTFNAGLVNGTAMGFACGNLLAAAGLTAGWSALGWGVCGIAHGLARKKATEEWCKGSCSLSDLPKSASRATCVNGKIIAQVQDQQRKT